MALKLSVRVGQTIEIGGPAKIRVETKSGQVIGLVFDADRSVPIKLIPLGETDGPPSPQGNGTIGLGREARRDSQSPGLGREK